MAIWCFACRSNDQEEAIIENLNIQLDVLAQDLVKDIKNNPGVADNYRRLAELYIEQEKYNEALRILKIGEAELENTALHTYIAWVHLLKEQIKEAAEYINDAGEDPLTLYVRSMYQYQSGGLTSSLDLINEALALDEGDAAFYGHKGDVLLKMGDTTDAVIAMQNAIRCSNATLGHYLKMGNTLVRKEQLAEAGRILQMAQQKFPDNDALLYERAFLYESQGKTDLAKRFYKRIEDDKWKLRSYKQLLPIYFSARQYDSLQFVIDQTLALKEENIEAKLFAARLHDRKRNYQEAIATYRKILSQDSTNEAANRELDALQRKVAYINRLRQQEKERESLRDIEPLEPLR